MDELSRLEAAFPAEAFDFYGQGMVLPAEFDPGVTGAHEIDADLAAIGYELRGDLTGVFVLLHEAGLDPDLYAEMGNVLASRWVSELSRTDIDVILSPPRKLATVRVRTLAQAPNRVARRSYLFQSAVGFVEVHALAITLPKEGQAHA